MGKYYPPQYQGSSFHCIHCQVYAHHNWDTLYTDPHYVGNGDGSILINSEIVKISLCANCNQPTFWTGEKILYPLVGMFPPANEDLPDSVIEIYNEAASVANQSSRAACALLRLAIEMLLNHLGETGSINEGIKNLVKKGLDVRVQQALDIVRVIGNSAVHPGVIAFDDATDVHALFGWINLVAETLITQPKRLEEMYDNLPQGSKKAIEGRDSKTQ